MTVIPGFARNVTLFPWPTPSLMVGPHGRYKEI